MSIFEWSTTAGDNATADGNINYAEGQAPSTLNNSNRAEMAALASYFQGVGGALTTAGTGSAYTLTLADAPTAYTTSMLLLVKFHAVSASATATINVNALGAKTLKLWDGSALPSASYIPVNAYGLIKYDGIDIRVFLPSIAYTQGSTDVAVADGGTGASTAAAAATNLGLGTGDSPQFTAVNIGHATDTTLARSSAGDVAVEGNLLYRAGGTDVPVADGGTGASTAAGARTNLAVPNIAGDTFTGRVSAPRYRTETVTVADDAIGTVDMNGFGICHVIIETTTQNLRNLIASGSIRARCAATPLMNNIDVDTTNCDLKTGDLLVNDQTNGKITVSAGATTLNIINRFGSSLTFTVTIFG